MGTTTLSINVRSVAANVARLRQKPGMMVSYNKATFLDVDHADPSLNIVFAPTLPPSTYVPEWVNVAADGGFGTITPTIEHEDGFATWNTDTSSHKSDVDHMDLLAAACQARGVGLFPYMNCRCKQYEADNPDSRWVSKDPTFLTAQKAAFKAYKIARYTEIFTRYGPLAGAWIDSGKWWFGTAGASFDYYPFDSWAEWKAFFRGLQSNSLFVGNNHDVDPTTSDLKEYEGGGLLTFPTDVPSDNPDQSEAVETIRTGDKQWFEKLAGTTLYTSAEIASIANTLNTRNTRLLMNASPNRTGNIPTAQAAIFRGVGPLLT